MSYLQELSDIYSNQINEWFGSMSRDFGTNNRFPWPQEGRHSYRSFPFNNPGRKGQDNPYATQSLVTHGPTPIAQDEEAEVTGNIDKQKVISYVNDLIEKATTEGMEYAIFELGKVKEFIVKN